MAQNVNNGIVPTIELLDLDIGMILKRSKE